MFSGLKLMLEGLRQKAVLRQSLDEILRLQERRLRQLMHHARTNSPFYAELYRGVDPEVAKLTDLPIVTKQSMMENFDRFLTVRDVTRSDLDRFMSDPARLGQWYQGRYAVSHTSGSSGLQAYIVQDRRGMELLFAIQTLRGSPFTNSLSGFLSRVFRRTRLAVITIGRGFYPSAAALAYAPRGARHFINRLWISKTDPIAPVVERLNAFQPEVVLAYANVLETLAREVADDRLKVHRDRGLVQIINMSEPLSEGGRQKLEEAFGVQVTDNYAMGECMALTTGCPTARGMHLQADWAILEVVDRENRPVPPGQPGEKVLLTNLYNTVQPFIRYEVQDIVTMSEQSCPCALPLPRILKVEGRTDEIVWIEDNGQLRSIHPYVLLDLLDEYPAVGWYQFVQTERNRFLLRAAPAPGRSFDETDLHAAIRRGLGDFGLAHVLTIEVQRDDRVGPDPKTGKLKRIVSQVKLPPGKE
jgi:phenylacetate-coenzyme A ligase PaaK-like adenylate-forming protein